MPRPGSILMALLLAASGLTTARAQMASVKVPVWLGTNANACGPAPKFQATINGKPARVTKTLGPSSDQLILLVSDLTGSLSLDGPAKQAMISQISKLPSHTWVALLRAQDGLRVLTNPGPNRKATIAAIQALTDSGQPGLLGTVTSALSLASAISRKAAVRVSVLYVTDGSIYSYREDYTNPVINQSDPYDLSRTFPAALIEDKISMLLDNANSIEAPLFVAQLEFRGDQLNVAYQNGIDALARATGGENLICQSDGDIPVTIAQIFHRILSMWLLTLALPPKTPDANIQMSAPCSAARSGLSWRAHIHLTGGLG